MVVDGFMVSVGSTNFDNRSFRLNDEENLNIYDEDFARRQIEIFEQDLSRWLALYDAPNIRDRVMLRAPGGTDQLQILEVGYQRIPVKPFREPRGAEAAPKPRPLR